MFYFDLNNNSGELPLKKGIHCSSHHALTSRRNKHGTEMEQGIYNNKHIE